MEHTIYIALIEKEDKDIQAKDLITEFFLTQLNIQYYMHQVVNVAGRKGAGPSCISGGACEYGPFEK